MPSPARAEVGPLAAPLARPGDTRLAVHHQARLDHPRLDQRRQREHRRRRVAPRVGDRRAPRHRLPVQPGPDPLARWSAARSTTGTRAPASSRPSSQVAPWGNASIARSHPASARVSAVHGTPAAADGRQQAERAPGRHSRSTGDADGRRGGERGDHGHVYEYTAVNVHIPPLPLARPLIFLVVRPSVSCARGRRVLVVGWDGADWEILDPLLDAASCPPRRR